MAKLKSIKQFREDAKEGDLIRLAGEVNSGLRKFEATGYLHTLEKQKAFFKYSPEEIDWAFEIDFRSERCINHTRKNYRALGIIRNYEILRRAKK